MRSALKVSDSRAHVVIEEIEVGSDTHWRFYALLIVSSMIACFGLAANSTAVIIGAMLVSPLMMPIFGIALAMLEGQPRLLGRALSAELIGAILAVGAGVLVGSFQLTAGEATTEMLARTQPNLIDLMVAVFAGFAGAYALVDERISPALPGVAIATAIVPPLSTCGMCIAMGAWSGAGGAMLLFLANLVSILIVALITFAVTGLPRQRSVQSWRGFARRFGPTVAAFAVVTMILTNSLMHITRERSVRRGIQEALRSELSHDLATDLDDFLHNNATGHVQVLATVRSPRVIKPARVSSMQRAIEERLRRPVDLVVRTLVAKDVSPTGSSLSVTTPDLDGSFLAERISGDDVQAKEALAEQVIREYFESEPGFELTNVDYGTASMGNGVVLAYINSVRRMRRMEIAHLETELQKRLATDDLLLLLRVNAARLEFSRGPVLAEWTRWQGVPRSEYQRMDQLEQRIRDVVIHSLGILPTHVHFNLEDGRNRVLVEVVGPKPVAPEDTARVEAELEKLAVSDVPIEMNFWYRSEYVVTPSGYTTFEDLSAPDLLRRDKYLRQMFNKEMASAQP